MVAHDQALNAGTASALSNMTAVTQSRSSTAYTVPRSQNTAPVHEFQCTFTHDIRRKNAKRWKDGFLRLHTFNNRLLVYDEARNFVQSGHHIGHPSTICDGAAFSLDIILVEVGLPIAISQTDLSEVVRKRSPKRVGDAELALTPEQNCRMQLHFPNHRKSKSLKSIRTPNSDASSPVSFGPGPPESGHDLQPPLKRPRTDDKHKPLCEILTTKAKSPHAVISPHTAPNMCFSPAPKNALSRAQFSSKEAAVPRIGNVRSGSSSPILTNNRLEQQRMPDTAVRDMTSPISAALHTKSRVSQRRRRLSQAAEKAITQPEQTSPERMDADTHISPPGLQSSLTMASLSSLPVTQSMLVQGPQNISISSLHGTLVAPDERITISQTHSDHHTFGDMLWQPDHQVEDIARASLAVTGSVSQPAIPRILPLSNGVIPIEDVDNIQKALSPGKGRTNSLRIRTRAPRRMLCQNLIESNPQRPDLDAGENSCLAKIQTNTRPLVALTKTPESDAEATVPVMENSPKNMHLEGDEPLDANQSKTPEAFGDALAMRRNYTELDMQLLERPQPAQRTSRITNLRDDLDAKPRLYEPRVVGQMHHTPDNECITKKSLVRPASHIIKQRSQKMRIFVSPAQPQSSRGRLPLRRYNSDLSPQKAGPPVPNADIVAQMAESKSRRTPSFEDIQPKLKATAAVPSSRAQYRSALRRIETVGHVPATSPHPTPFILFEPFITSERNMKYQEGPWTSEAWDLFGWCPKEKMEGLNWSYDRAALTR